MRSDRHSDAALAPRRPCSRQESEEDRGIPPRREEVVDREQRGVDDWCPTTVTLQPREQVASEIQLLSDRSSYAIERQRDHQECEESPSRNRFPAPSATANCRKVVGNQENTFSASQRSKKTMDTVSTRKNQPTSPAANKAGWGVAAVTAPGGGGLGGGRRLRMQRPMMTDVGIRTGEEKRLSPVVGPAYEVGRSSLLAHLDDLAVSHRTVEHGRCDHDSVAHYCFHRCSSPS